MKSPFVRLWREVISRGKRVRGIEEVEGGKYALTFTDGDVESFDLVIGADGVWSKVRKLVTDVMPEYKGIAGLDTRISKIDERFPELAKHIGEGDIILIGSMSAYVLGPHSTVYAGIKAGLQGFSIALRRELGPKGIRVSLVEPGLTGSDMQLQPKASNSSGARSNCHCSASGTGGRWAW